jgi:hypothetical protein
MFSVRLSAAVMATMLWAMSSPATRPLAAQEPELADPQGAPDHMTTAPQSSTAEPIEAGCPAGSQQQGGSGRHLPLFYNYYVGPPGVPAQIYPMPRPTPAYVGQVWITYPPLMPHEFLYHHHRRYYRYTPSGYSSASIRYSSGIMGFLPSF